MCGFAGLINLAGLSASAAERQAHLAAMGAQLSRRGPDDEQFYDDGYLSLVFRRLSIIDLAGGQQPIWNEDHSILSVVNGEIFNHLEIRERLKSRHQFGSRSDSEVVVHLYEEGEDELLQLLNGMYALLVWDTRERRLLLARDRLGIKPLFYAETAKGLLFGSELKALLAHPDCPRDIRWGDFEHSLGFTNQHLTFLRGVQQLAGGQALAVSDASGITRKTYWQVQDFFAAAGEQGSRDPQWWSQRYGELLQDSVSRQLMSDVPLGVFLSGGIDSSLLAAMAATSGQELHCFTVVEENTLATGDVEQTLRLAEHFGFRHYPVHYDTRTILGDLQFDLEDFEFLVWAVERPQFHPEWFLKLELHRYARTALPGLKVILLGQGADEFAGGYSRGFGSTTTDWQHYCRKLASLHTGKRRIDRGVPSYMHPSLADSFMAEPDDNWPTDFHREMVARTSLLMNYNLWHEDRTSSSQGVEARVPFLDHRLVELLASVPAELHEQLFFDKRIVRDQLLKAAPVYPPSKQKVGFYNGGRDDTIKFLRLDVVRRVYPAFREKYLGNPQAIFSSEALDDHYQYLMQNPKASKQDIKEMLSCMAISVFAAWCRDLAVAGPPRDRQRPSPLRLWTPPAPKPASASPSSEWTMELPV
jgi:asparagine synthase (glutamine-hydrolysing)